MGWSGALVCHIAFVLVLLSSASGDESRIEQKKVTILQEMQMPDSFMLQTPVDFTEFLKDLDLGNLSPPQGGSTPQMTPRGRRPIFDPSSYGGPVERYPVQFPLGRPTSDNLQAICLHGDRRPSYPKSYFPDSGFGSQVRMGSAVNNAESWFSTCCKKNQTWERELTLCCATQAWNQSISSFCEEEFSIKTLHYHCCKLDNTERLDCFHNNAPNPNYEPSEEIPVPPLPSTADFKFDPSTCQREMEPSTSQKTNVNFPPGRPTADTIKSLCHNQILRPLYNVTCMPGVGYQLLARQAKTINRMEKGFEQCCKKQDMLRCADRKWREELNKFCLGKDGRQVDFHCCSSDGASDRYSCFQQISPDPHYNITSTTEEISLNKICDTHEIIKMTFPVRFPLKTFVDQCCPLSEQDKTICSVQKLEEMSRRMCSSRRVPPAVRRCCLRPTQETPQCISKILMDAITKAISVSRQKKKKCPIS